MYWYNHSSGSLDSVKFLVYIVRIPRFLDKISLYGYNVWVKDYAYAMHGIYVQNRM